MKFAFPILTAAGEEFKDVKALTALIKGEKSGHYLLGNHNKWHGGIHISDQSAPWCKDKYPVRAIADGKVVAFRMMENYLTSEFQGESLRYSNCFCLVQHEYCEINTETKAKNEFTFYSLYMHLLPWSQYQTTEKLVLKKGWNARNSVPHANPDADQQRADAALPRFALPKDTELEIDSSMPTQKGNVGGKEYDFIKVIIKSKLSSAQLKEAEKAGILASEGSSVWIANSPDAVTFIKPNLPTWLFDQIDAELLTNMIGRADPVLDGPTGRLMAGDKSVSLPAGTKLQYDAHQLEFHWIGEKTRKMARCKYVMPSTEGAAGSCGMAWVCVEDEYIKANTLSPSHLGELYVLPSPVAIAAGETIGYLGLVETPGSLMGGKESKHQVHLELFTQDPRLDDVLANKAGTKGGATYAKVPAELVLHEKKKQDGKELWVATGGKSLEELVEFPKLEKDASKQEWVSVSSGKYVKKEQVELLSQHDWLKIGFKKVDGSGSDGYLDPEAPPTFFTNLVKSFDTDGNGELSSKEIRAALQNSGNADQLHKLIVKHPSEWYEKSSASSYLWLDKLMAKIGLPDFDKLVDHEKQRIDKLEWMQSATKLKFNGDVSHFYPFSIVMKPMISEYTITTELIELLLGHKKDWFTGERGGKDFASKFKKDYPNVYKYDKTSFVELLNEMLFKYEINGPYHKAHFLSQCLHESAHLDTTLEFGSGVNYDPGRHADAEKNGNTKIGDGPTYRGRGLIQLTWKNNYKRFSKYSGVDCVNDSSLVAASMANAIEASCWYWRFNGAVHKKFDAKGDINILIDNDRDNVTLITLAVNGGDNGLLDRMKYFNLIKREWGLN